MGSGTDAAKNQPEARPLKGGCDEGGGHRKWLDLVHGRDRRASRHPKRHEDQDREQGRRLSGVVAGAGWPQARSALGKRGSQHLPQTGAVIFFGGGLAPLPGWSVITRGMWWAAVSLHGA